MGDAWKHLDLGGGGLQAANLRLAALLRKRGVACGLLALFPLGLHRDYLYDRRGAWLYRGGTLLGVAALLLGLPLLAGLTLAAGAAFAMYDLVQIDDAVARVNKRLRMQVYLSQSAGAPQGFRGHYTDAHPPDDEQERTGREPGSTADVQVPSRAPSFAEQEKRLRELTAMRKKGGK